MNPSVDEAHSETHDCCFRYDVAMPRRVSEQYAAELVLRVNEVFHDVEGSGYARMHPEIYAGEAARWDEIARRKIGGRARPLRVLDFGCGAGFVAQRVAPFLSADDTLICADLSQAMLDTCRRTLLDDGSFTGQFEFVKLDGRTIPLGDGSCDAVTMNSVLHHLPEPGATLREIDRVLRPGGVLVIGHEPNRRFYASRAMRLRAALAGVMLSPRRAAGAVLRRLGLMGMIHRIVRRAGRGHHGDVLAEVNRRLLAQGAITQPLSQDELTAIVDIGSPTAGGWHPRRGIDVQFLAGEYLPNYRCELTTYDHLGAGSDGAINGWIGSWARRIAKHHPFDGATLLAVLIKPAGSIVQDRKRYEPQINAD